MRRVSCLLLLAACTRASSEQPVAAAAPSAAPSAADSGVSGVSLTPPMPSGWTPPARAKAAYPAGVIVIVPGKLPYGVGHDTVVHEVVVDEKDAFFSDGYGNVWRAPKDGSGSASLVWDGKKGHGMSLVLDGGDVVFSLKPHVAGASSKPMIVRVPKAGGAHVTLSVETEDPLYLSSDGANVFFSLFDGTSVRRIPIKGGASVAVRTPGIRSGALAVDGSSLYVSDYARGTVSKIPKSGGAETTLASGMPKPVGIAIDETHVYFPCETDGSVRRVPKAGGPVQTIATGQINNDELAVDETWVYWSTWDKSHALVRVKKDGSSKPATMLSGLREPTGISLDAGHVYLANKGAGEVLVVPK